MFKKIAQPAYWTQLLPLLRQQNYGTFHTDVMSILNTTDRIIFETSPPPGEPKAIAYVTTEDSGASGKIESIHFVIPNMPKTNNFEDSVNEIVVAISGVVAHEVAHQKDYKKELKDKGIDPFPGGEAVAEQAQKQQEERVMKNLDLTASEGLKRVLVKLSNNLDISGNKTTADSVDGVLFSISKQDRVINKTAGIKDGDSPSDVTMEEAFMFGDSFAKKPFGR